MKFRFIAGAVCPACSEMDVVQGRMEQGTLTLARCVCCGWESDRPPEEPAAQEAIPVRILDPNGPSDQKME